MAGACLQLLMECEHDAGPPLPITETCAQRARQYRKAHEVVGHARIAAQNPGRVPVGLR
jgi:hypothetical protein